MHPHSAIIDFTSDINIFLNVLTSGCSCDNSSPLNSPVSISWKQDAFYITSYNTPNRDADKGTVPPNPQTPFTFYRFSPKYLFPFCSRILSRNTCLFRRLSFWNSSSDCRGHIAGFTQYVYFLLFPVWKSAGIKCSRLTSAWLCLVIPSDQTQVIPAEQDFLRNNAVLSSNWLGLFLLIELTMFSFRTC